MTSQKMVAKETRVLYDQKSLKKCTKPTWNFHGVEIRIFSGTEHLPLLTTG